MITYEEQGRLPPFKHQAEALERAWDLGAFAVFWEQRTGKTRFILDNTVKLARKGLVNSLLVITDNGIHRQWITDEIPKHLPGANVEACFYTSTKANSKAHKAALERAIHAKGFSVVAMSWHGFMTDKGTAFAKRFLTRRRVFYVLDEATAIKNPKAKRTKRIVSSGRYSDYKRILTGTPVTKSPFDVYMPIKFLDQYFWKRNGFPTFTGFKLHFGVWQEGYNSRTGQKFSQCVAYRNLDQLRDILKKISSRVLRSEVFDAPPTLYSKVYFDMVPEQRRMYEKLRDEFIVELESGSIVEAPLVITQMMRLHQITCGYLPDSEGDPERISQKNPRLDRLTEVCDNSFHQAIIWCRFKPDVDMIMDLHGKKAVRYDGQVSDDARQRNKEAFIAGDVQFFVSRVDVASKGHDFSNAGSLIYYTNNFDLELRLQSEDRPKGPNQKNPVGCVDIVAPGTVDDNLVESFRNKLNIANMVTGDKARDWI